MRFIVVGAGAIGCYVGGRLAAGGRKVTLVGRPRGIDALAASGLTITDLDGFRAHVAPHGLQLATSLAQVRMCAQDVVLLCVKGGATESAALQIAACCPSGSSVVSLQNGVDNVARITAIASAMKPLAGMVACNVVMPSASHVHRATAGMIYMARNTTTLEMALLMDACGLKTVLANDMRSVQWGKLLLNLNNPVNALSDLPMRLQLMDRDYRRVLAALQREALAAMRAAGIKPARVGAAPPTLLPRILSLPNWLFKALAARMLRMDESARSSMWDDLQQGRVTEIDDLCGAVVRLGAQHGIPTLHNSAMCRLIAAYHRGERLSGQDMRSAALP
ncbi:MAG: 2-dehydropantoate 2-reductase [Burkholderiaceae bacterium]